MPPPVKGHSTNPSPPAWRHGLSLFFRRNVEVFSLTGRTFNEIGKTRVSKVVSPSFIVLLDRFTAKGLDNKTVTINYGDSSFQHIVTLSNADEKGEKKDYQIDVDF